MDLVIVESPGKIKKIQEYLGKHYEVIACFGHCIDLNPKKISVDIKKDFSPTFIILNDKKEVVDKIQKKAKSAKITYLFMDSDREGEGMARNLSQILPANVKWKRGRFQAITKTEITKAIQNADAIDQNMVHSYECRRIMDRLCGYKTSFLTTMATGGKSAGRVQSAILRIIVDREKEILSFVPVEYWVLTAKFLTHQNEQYIGVLDDKIPVHNATDAQSIYDSVMQGQPLVTDVESKDSILKPYAPFTTSTLIQSASTILGWNAHKTMQIAQSLYENAATTYIRSDSTFIDPSFVDQIRSFVTGKFAASYLPHTANVYQSKKGSQEAHECVRVTDVNCLPNQCGLGDQERKLYTIIWKRTIACQMQPGIDIKTKIATTSGGYDFITRGTITKFDGFRAIWDYSASDDIIVPKLQIGDSCKIVELTKEQKWTNPPPRYSDASLAKKCETELISRPATFANAVQTLYSRDYIEQLNKSFRPTELGMRVIDFLVQSNFCFANIKFTAAMEQKLDDILDEKANKTDVLKEFWSTLKDDIGRGNDILSKQKMTDYDCPKCDGKLCIKYSKFGQFFSCSNYKKKGGCDYLAVPDANGQPVEKKKKEKEYASFACNECGSKMVKRNSSYGVFFGCEKFPTCRSVADLNGNFKSATQSDKGKTKYFKKSKKKTYKD